MQRTNKSPKPPAHPSVTVFITLLLVWVVGFNFDFYLPGMPKIAEDFGSTHNITRLSVALFLIGLGLGQFVCGLLVDLWCRRKVLLLSLFLLCIDLILFLFVNDIVFFIILRFFQGLFAAGSAIGAKVIITDTFSGKMRERWYGIILSFWALGFVISPLIGGPLIHYLGWRTSFWVLLIYGILILLISYLLLGETQPKEKITMQDRSRLYANIHTICVHPFFIFGVICMCFEGAFIFLNYKMSPFILEVGLNYSVKEYGFFAFLMALSYFCGSVLNTILLSYVSIQRLMLISNIALIILSIIFLLLGIFIGLTIWGFLLPLLGILFFLAMYFNNVMTKTVNIIPVLVGTANAVIFLLYYLLVGIYLIAASLFPIDTQVPLGISFFISSVVILIMYFFGAKREKAKH